MVRKPIPIGTRYSHLLVIGSPVKAASGRYMCLCRCDCGAEKLMYEEALKYGNSRSCGCVNRKLSRERIIANRDRRVSHGMCGTRLHRIWKAMKYRCSNPSAQYFHRYGGRGISVCEAWRTSFIAFHEWAMQHGYRDDLSIDRIDNDGDYTPENCRWVAMDTQARNTRQNRFITAFGLTKCLEDWASDLSCAVDISTLRKRLRLGWEFEKAFSLPPRPISTRKDRHEQHSV